jgi:hypothetical protein
MRKSEMEQELARLKGRMKGMELELLWLGILGECDGFNHYYYTGQRGWDVKHLDISLASLEKACKTLRLILDYLGLCYEESHMTEPRLVACTDEGESDEQD